MSNVMRVIEICGEYEQDLEILTARWAGLVEKMEEGETILMCVWRHSPPHIMRAALSSPLASKIRMIMFASWHGATEFADSITSNCPLLTNVDAVAGGSPRDLEFLARVLDNPQSRVTKLALRGVSDVGGRCIKHLFAALALSKVTELSISFSDLGESAEKYFKTSLLKMLTVEAVRLDLVACRAIAGCRHLEKLILTVKQLDKLPAIPASVTSLTFSSCRFGSRFDWTFLEKSNVQVLKLRFITLADWEGLGRALVVRLAGGDMERLALQRDTKANEVLRALGPALAGIKALMLTDDLCEEGARVIAAAIQSPRGIMRRLSLHYSGRTRGDIEAFIVPVLNSPRCSLNEFVLYVETGASETQARVIVQAFARRTGLLTLLQGQQVRRLRGPLRRLPVEMMRLVSQMLI